MTTTLTTPQAPSDLRLMLLIARRGALESLRDRMTLLLNILFALVFPVFIVLTTLRPVAAASADTGQTDALGSFLATFLLIVGLLPTSSSVGIAAGQFAGEKEQGSLTPLLAAPASNIAIFGGKVLVAVIPPLLFSLIAEIVFVSSIALIIGSDALRLTPPELALAMLALVPAFAVFGATLASLISSRVRTFNTAQQITGLALVPVWGLLMGLAFNMKDWGTWALIVAVAGFIVVDIALALFGAATWRREEVLAQR